MTRKWWFAGAALVIVLLVGVYQAVAYDQAVDRDVRARINGAALPDGTEKAWAAYVDRRIAATLRRREDAVAVRADLDGFLGNVTDVPFGTSYDVVCPRDFGGLVRFSLVGETITASIFGSSVVEPPAERPPVLGVDPHSIAALGLQKELCGRITTGVRAVMAH